MTERVRLAQILYSGLGGHGDVAFGIIENDDSGQFEHVPGFLGVEPLLPAYAAECRERGMDYGYIRATAGKPWRGWRPLYRWLRKVRPDAVLLHSPSALLPCAAYARRRKIPLIVAEHQPTDLRSRPDWLFTRLSFVIADRVVILTGQSAATVEERIGPFYAKEKARIIGNGIHLKSFERVRPTFSSPGKIVLGMAGRFRPAKRFDLLIGMIDELYRLAPDTDWRLILAGDGETSEDVRAMAFGTRHPERIEFAGTIAREEMPKYLESLDIYVHATEGETLSISILQAMASRLPIVASDVLGVNAVLDRRTACLVSGQDPRAFATAVNRLTGDKQEAKKMAGRAYAECRERYSVDLMSETYRNLVLELIEVKKARL